VVAVELGRIEGSDRRSLVHGEFARPIAGHAADQQPHVQEFAVRVDAEPALAGGGRLRPAVHAAQREQGQPGPANDPGPLRRGRRQPTGTRKEGSNAFPAAVVPVSGGWPASPRLDKMLGT
jgi:hypothetical protein